VLYQSPYASLSCGVHVIPPSRDVVVPNRPQEEEADQTMKYLHEILQSNEELRILNDRPYKDVRITPLALLYSPFGEFLDHIRNPPTISDDVHLKKLEDAVDEFSFLMCQYYDDEEARRKEVLTALNTIFECYLPSHLTRIIPSPSSGSGSSGGHAEGPAGVLEVIVEFKNEFGIGRTDPEVQITGCYLRSIHEERSGPNRALYESFLFPALGISLMGKGHKHDLFKTLVVINSYAFCSRFVYWIQCSRLSRSMQIR
jgi:hypothetical protein